MNGHKTIIMKTNNRILIALALTLSTCMASANPVEENPNPSVVMKYAGSIGNDPLFHLQISSSNPHPDFLISISDNNGITLFREDFSGNNFSKRFLINKDEVGDETLRVEIRDRRSRKVVTYLINNDNLKREE